MRRLVVLCLSLLLAACFDQAPAGTSTAGDATFAASKYHERGRAIYNLRCYFCHGYSGDAHTLASAYLNPRPRDFSAMSADQMSREQMLNSVVSGLEATAMKGFSDVLSVDEIAQVVDFIRQEFVIAKARNDSLNASDAAWPYGERSTAFPHINDTVSPPPLSYPLNGIQLDDWPEAWSMGNPIPLSSLPEVGKGAPRHPN